ncbi:MAG: hypothetical protein AAF658_10890 [Myxococcota bacterium]
MDELTRRLREDAKRIDAQVFEDQEARLLAALESTEPAVIRPRGVRWTWVLAAAAGIAAAAALVALLPAEEESAESAESTGLMVSNIDADAATDEILDPLSTEYENLQSDFIKVRQKLRTRISF